MFHQDAFTALSAIYALAKTEDDDLLMICQGLEDDRRQADNSLDEGCSNGPRKSRKARQHKSMTEVHRASEEYDSRVK